MHEINLLSISSILFQLQCTVLEDVRTELRKPGTIPYIPMLRNKAFYHFSDTD